MMEAFSSVHTIIKLLSEFGVIGVVLIMWWVDRKDLKKVLDQYRMDMAEIRQMYKNNVHLVEGYEKLATDLKDVIILNTQTNSKLGKSIEDNQFCPMVRLERKAPGPVGGK